MEEEGSGEGEELSSGEGVGVKGEVGRKVDTGGQYEGGESSLEVGKSCLKEVGASLEVGRTSLKVDKSSLKVGRSSLKVGRSSLARSKSCQGSPGLASCYMAWLNLEWRE